MNINQSKLNPKNSWGINSNTNGIIGIGEGYISPNDINKAEKELYRKLGKWTLQN